MKETYDLINIAMGRAPFMRFPMANGDEIILQRAAVANVCKPQGSTPVSVHLVTGKVQYMDSEHYDTLAAWLGA